MPLRSAEINSVFSEISDEYPRQQQPDGAANDGDESGFKDDHLQILHQRIDHFKRIEACLGNAGAGK